MNLFLIFSIILISIVFGIFIQRLIHSPILVGLIVFSVLLLISAITNNTLFTILAVILSVIAFLSALFDCLFSQCNFWRVSNCLKIGDRSRMNCNNSNENNCGNNSISSTSNSGIGILNNNNNNCCNSSQRLTILNSEGEVVARINGNNVTCVTDENQCNNGSTSCSCRRSYR